MVAMAHANDGGGSIRIPASCCGLFGFKPTRARITLGPLLGDIQNGLVNEHAVTRSVRDSAALLDATQGSMPGDPYVAPDPVRPYLQEVGADPGHLRIAFSRVTSTGIALHPDCIAAVEDAAKLCQELGHQVVEDSPPINGDDLIQSFTILWAAGTAEVIDTIAALSGRQPKPEDFEVLTWALYEAGKETKAGDYLIAVGKLQMLGRAALRRSPSATSNRRRTSQCSGSSAPPSSFRSPR
jgi:amidase